MNPIKEFRGKYYFLSNFFCAPVEYCGIIYQNNEAAFQSMKCEDYERRHEFSTLDPSKAKAKGRKVRLRNDWEQVKEQIMYEIVKAKFEQNDDLRVRLLATGDAHLEEGNTWGDRIWGTVGGVGQNKLGKILMKVRSELAIDKRKRQA